jgi:hypothetical protein
MAEKEYIDIDPVEELLVAIGVVHGEGYEQAWRRALLLFEARHPRTSVKFGENLVSLLDYARLLKEDPSAADMIIQRVDAMDKILKREGISWVRAKDILLEAVGERGSHVS